MMHPGPQESETSPCPSLTIFKWRNCRSRGAERALAYLCGCMVAGGMKLASCYREELRAWSSDDIQWHLSALLDLGT